MISPYFVAFELLMLAAFVMCAWHSLTIGLHRLALLVAGVVFGVLLELATIRQLNAYHYGQFAVMIFDVPLAIGVGWGVITYSVRLYSDATNLPEWAKPVLDGLLALNIDLATDAIAIRLGMWDWGQGLGFQYFGVPFANFWAWFWVVFAFSLGSRLLMRQPGVAGKWLPPFAAVIVGLVGVLGTNALIVFVVPDSIRTPVIAVTLLAAFVTVTALRPKLSQPALAAPAFWIPFTFHVFFIVTGIISGAIFNNIILVVMSIAMFGISLYLHRAAIGEWVGARRRQEA